MNQSVRKGKAVAAIGLVIVMAFLGYLIYLDIKSNATGFRIGVDILLLLYALGNDIQILRNKRFSIFFVRILVFLVYFLVTVGLSMMLAVLLIGSYKQGASAYFWIWLIPLVGMVAINFILFKTGLAKGFLDFLSYYKTQYVPSTTTPLRPPARPPARPSKRNRR